MIAEQNQLPSDFDCTNKQAIQIKMIFSSDKKSLSEGSYHLVNQIFQNYKQHVKQIGINSLRIEDSDQVYSKYWDPESTKTKRQLLNDIKTFFSNDYEYNALYIFGHGARINIPDVPNQTYFLWFYHNKLEYISLSQIINLWFPEKTKHLLIIFNGCRSGNWVQQIRNSPKKASITIIGSCQQNQISTIKYMKQNDVKELTKSQISEENIKIGFSYFILVFFSCLIEKFNDKPTVAKIIDEIKDKNKNPENYQIFQSIGFIDIIQDICNDQQIAFDNQKKKIQWKQSIKKRHPIKKNNIFSIYTGGKRFMIGQSQQIQSDSNCGIFHKRTYQYKKKKINKIKPYVFYEGGLKRFQFHGFGRVSLEKKHSFAKYIRRQHINKQILGYSEIKGETLTKIRDQHLNKFTIQEWHLNQSTTAKIPQDPLLTNIGMEINYIKTKYPNNQDQIQYLNINNISNIKTAKPKNKILTLKMRVDSKSRKNIRISATYLLNDKQIQFKYKKIQQLNKEFAENTDKYIQTLKVTIQNKINGKINLTQNQKQICFQIPHHFHYNKLFDQILLKQVNYIFQVYQNREDKTIYPIYYIQSLTQHQAFIKKISLLKIMNFLKLSDQISSMYLLQNFKKIHKNKTQRDKYTYFIQQNIYNFASKLYKIIHLSLQQIKTDLLSKVDEIKKENRKQKDKQKEIYIGDLFKRVVEFISNNENKKRIQSEVQADNQHKKIQYK